MIPILDRVDGFIVRHGQRLITRFIKAKGGRWYVYAPRAPAAEPVERREVGKALRYFVLEGFGVQPYQL